MNCQDIMDRQQDYQRVHVQESVQQGIIQYQERQYVLVVQLVHIRVA